MRASVLRNGHMVYRDDVDEPVPGPGQVLVGVRACGICGSDLHFAKHGHEMLALGARMRGLPSTGAASLDLRRDVFMGHEFSAEVLDAGPGTDAPPRGTLVTSIPALLSPNGVDSIVYSNTAIGGYAERMLLSAPLLLKVPNGLDPDTCIKDTWFLQWPQADDPPRRVERRFFADWTERDWGEITNQDYANMAHVQIGMKNRRGPPIRLNRRQELNILHMHKVIDRYLTAS